MWESSSVRLLQEWMLQTWKVRFHFLFSFRRCSFSLYILSPEQSDLGGGFGKEELNVVGDHHRLIP